MESDKRILENKKTSKKIDHFAVIYSLSPMALSVEKLAILSRFEATGMDDEMPDDYQTLLAILDDAVTRQREHTRAMLGRASVSSLSHFLIDCGKA